MCVGHCGRHGVYGIKKDTLVSELMDGSVGIYGFFIRQMLFVGRLKRNNLLKEDRLNKNNMGNFAFINIQEDTACMFFFLPFLAVHN